MNESEARHMFAIVDADQDGVITLKEWFDYASKTGKLAMFEELKSVDTDGSATVTQEEFVKHYAKS
ncbi:EF-hand domain-containing protein [Streptomyces sp. NPDC126514]|uniref:EF-hand domain-containing protein n=1 Tax=Streptomyces sp. NPDC126514 TaxID=3155210 RepID=UPI00332B2D54